jgi:hypothetical protein
MSLAAPSLAQAIDHLMRAIASDPTYAEAFHELADQVATIDPARAVSLYRRALALDPRLDVNWADLAIVHLQLGQLDQLNDVAAQSATAAPGTVGALIAGALVNVTKGDGMPMLAVVRQLVDRMRDRRLPGLQLLLARTQMVAGRTKEAQDTLRAIAESSPQFCEGRALYAGVVADTGHRAEARGLVNTILAQASADGALPQLARCAANATAALGDAPATAGWLRRIAADEERLRWWGLTAAGPMPDLQLGLRLYPWQKVADSQEVRAALAEIEKARAGLRPMIAAKLVGLP